MLWLIKLNCYFIFRLQYQLPTLDGYQIVSKCCVRFWILNDFFFLSFFFHFCHQPPLKMFKMFQMIPSGKHYCKFSEAKQQTANGKNHSMNKLELDSVVSRLMLLNCHLSSHLKKSHQYFMTSAKQCRSIFFYIGNDNNRILNVTYMCVNRI